MDSSSDTYSSDEWVTFDRMFWVSSNMLLSDLFVSLKFMYVNVKILSPLFAVFKIYMRMQKETEYHISTENEESSTFTLRNGILKCNETVIVR